MQTTPTKYLTVPEVADRYQQTKKWVHDRTRTRTIPHIRHSRMRAIVFDPAALDAWDAGCELEVREKPDGSRFVVPAKRANEPC